jgi:anti-sigma B factor antagonist
MRLQSEIRDGVYILSLKGRFTTGSDAEFLSARDRLQKAGVANAILNLAEVPYVDSTGLAFIVELHKALASRGGRLVLANANERVREVLALTHINRVIPLSDDLTSAEMTLHESGALVACNGC